MKGRTKGEGRKEKGDRRKEKARSEKGEAKAMQPSCTEPNPRGTKGKKQEGGEKEKEKRKEKGKASPKIIGRGYGLASAIDYPQISIGIKIIGDYQFSALTSK